MKQLYKMKQFNLNDLLDYYKKELKKFIKLNKEYSILLSNVEMCINDGNIDFNYIDPKTNNRVYVFTLESTGDLDEVEFKTIKEFKQAAYNLKYPYDFEEEPFLFNNTFYFGLCSSIKDVFIFVHLSIEIQIKYITHPTYISIGDFLRNTMIERLKANNSKK